MEIENWKLKIREWQQKSRQSYSQELVSQGFTRVERDDRLLDIFPNQTREKGIELWEKWTGQEVVLFRFFVDLPSRPPEAYKFNRSAVESALLNNQLLQFPPPSL